MTLLSSLVGPLKLEDKARQKLYREVVPWAVQVGGECQFLLNVMYEELLEKDLERVRKDLGIFLRC